MKNSTKTSELALSANVLLYLADTTGWFDLVRFQERFKSLAPKKGLLARTLEKLMKLEAISLGRPSELGRRKAIRLRSEARNFILSVERSEAALVQRLEVLIGGLWRPTHVRPRTVESAKHAKNLQAIPNGKRTLAVGSIAAACALTVACTSAPVIKAEPEIRSGCTSPWLQRGAEPTAATERSAKPCGPFVPSAYMRVPETSFYVPVSAAAVKKMKAPDVLVAARTEAKNIEQASAAAPVVEVELAPVVEDEMRHNIFFASGSARGEFDASPLQELISGTTDLKGKYVVVGSTDNKGSAALNLKLAKARALMAKNMLQQMGVDAKQIEIKLAPMAEKKLRVKGKRSTLPKTLSAQARRVDVIFVAQAGEVNMG
jgi:outer membrane protein OmpA-like peptidoglycan-associated protein